jgi:hypothetical protein
MTKARRPQTTPAAASASAPWLVHFFRRHASDDSCCDGPGRDFLERASLAAFSANPDGARPGPRGVIPPAVRLNASCSRPAPGGTRAQRRP